MRMFLVLCRDAYAHAEVHVFVQWFHTDDKYRKCPKRRVIVHLKVITNWCPSLLVFAEQAIL